MLQDTPDPTAIAALFKDSFTIVDLQGNHCTAPGPAAAKALADLTIRYIGGLWPVDTGFQMALTTRSSGGALSTATAQAGDCVLGGAGVGGYVITIQSGSDQPLLASAQAVDRPIHHHPHNGNPSSTSLNNDDLPSGNVGFRLHLSGHEFRRYIPQDETYATIPQIAGPPPRVRD